MFYLLTFVSIPTLFLYSAVRGANYVVGPGRTPACTSAASLRSSWPSPASAPPSRCTRWSSGRTKGVALGFVAARTLEAAAIFAGVFTLLAVVALRQSGAGAAELATGQALVGLHDWTFTLGQSLIPAVNGLLLGYLLYKSRLVPRILPVIGFIGAPLLIASTMATLFGANEYGSSMSGLMAIPIALWEFSLGVYLVVRGFRAAGLQQLGFETVETDATAVATAPTSEMRPAA